MADKKVDFKKDFKDLYQPGKKPSLIDVPEMNFIMMDGRGAPEGEEYQRAVSILYSLTFTIKMSKMGAHTIEGYYEYTVPPLEGFWSGGLKGFDPDRDNWTWTSLIRQPDFVTPEVFSWALEEAARKKPDIDFEGVRFGPVREGLCVQVMHIGPFAQEQPTVDLIGEYIRDNDLLPDFSDRRRHHEIYLSDYRKTAPERLKTIIRHPVKK